MSLNYNQEILHRNHESNHKGDMRALLNSVAIVATSNLADKLKIDDSIEPRITDCMLDVAMN